MADAVASLPSYASTGKTPVPAYLSKAVVEGKAATRAAREGRLVEPPIRQTAQMREIAGLGDRPKRCLPWPPETRVAGS